MAGEGPVFFDIDGTLVDTNYLHTWAWWQALADHGVSATMAQVHRLIGRSGDDLLTELASGPDDRISAAHQRYFRQYREFIRPLPGARALLAHVHRSGHRVVIVTSAEPDELELLLAPLGADAVIDEIVHGGDVEEAKPAPDPFQRALERTGAAASQVVAVGDTGWDVEAARRAGIACLAVETGGVAACELLAAGAKAVYRSCADLLDSYGDSILAA